MSPAQIPPGCPADAWARIGGARVDGGWAYPERTGAGEVVNRVTRWDSPRPGRPRFTAEPGAPRGLAFDPDALRGYAGTGADDPIIVTEGASDAVCLLALGFAAVAAPNAHGGAAELAELLRGRHVVLMGDADDAGRRGAATLAAALRPVCASVRVAFPPPPHKDARQWVVEGGAGADDVERLIAAAVSAEPAPAPIDGAPVVPALDLNSVIPNRAAYARDYFTALSRSTQTPIEMPALLGLAIASAAVCNVARVRGHGDHVEPAQLWALVLCEPAVRKSAVLSELLAPIMVWEKRQADELGPVIAAAVQRRKIDENG